MGRPDADRENAKRAGHRPSAQDQPRLPRQVPAGSDRGGCLFCRRNLDEYEVELYGIVFSLDRVKGRSAIVITALFVGLIVRVAK